MVTKIGKIVGNVAMILIFIIGIYTFFGILLGGGTAEDGSAVYNDTAVSTGLNTSIYVIAIAGILAVIFGVARLFLDFKKNAKVLISLVVFLVVALIVYFTASEVIPEKTQMFMAKNGSEPDEIESTAKMVDFGLKMTVTLVFIAVASILVGWTVSMVKRLR